MQMTLQPDRQTTLQTDIQTTLPADRRADGRLSHSHAASQADEEWNDVGDVGSQEEREGDGRHPAAAAVSTHGDEEISSVVMGTLSRKRKLTESLDNFRHKTSLLDSECGVAARMDCAIPSVGSTWSSTTDDSSDEEGPPLPLRAQDPRFSSDLLSATPPLPIRLHCSPRSDPTDPADPISRVGPADVDPTDRLVGHADSIDPADIDLIDPTDNIGLVIDPIDLIESADLFDPDDPMELIDTCGTIGTTGRPGGPIDPIGDLIDPSRPIAPGDPRDPSEYLDPTGPIDREASEGMTPMSPLGFIDQPCGAIDLRGTSAAADRVDRSRALDPTGETDPDPWCLRGPHSTAPQGGDGGGGEGDSSERRVRLGRVEAVGGRDAATETTRGTRGDHVEGETRGRGGGGGGRAVCRPCLGVSLQGALRRPLPLPAGGQEAEWPRVLGRQPLLPVRVHTQAPWRLRQARQHLHRRVLLGLPAASQRDPQLQRPMAVVARLRGAPVGERPDGPPFPVVSPLLAPLLPRLGLPAALPDAARAPLHALAARAVRSLLHLLLFTLPAHRGLRGEGSRLPRERSGRGK
ncbi:uncharacterized protein LOC144735418 isoform X2 [Lampetra planeri]